MNHLNAAFNTPISRKADLNPALQRQNQIHDDAKSLAEDLRREAMGDFWRSANAVLATGISSVGRSAERLRHALSRRTNRTKVRATCSVSAQRSHLAEGAPFSEDRVHAIDRAHHAQRL